MDISSAPTCAATVPDELPTLTRLKALRALASEDRDRELREEANAIAALINADLAKPATEREWTALTTLDGVDGLDSREVS